MILAGYGDRMDQFFASNPGFRSRIAHHIDFPDYCGRRAARDRRADAARANYRFSADAREAFERLHRAAHGPSRSSPTRARSATRSTASRLRQANRLVSDLDRMLDVDDLETIDPADILGEPRLQRRCRCAERKAMTPEIRHRAVDPVGGFRAARRGDRGDRRGRRRLDPLSTSWTAISCRTSPSARTSSRRSGRRTKKVFRRASDDRAGRSLSRGLRRRPAPTSSPSMPRPARISTARCRRSARSARRPASPEPGDAGERDRICARPSRSRAGDDGQSGLRRPGLHPAQLEKIARIRSHDRRPADPARGRWRHHARQRRRCGRGRRRHARRRLRRVHRQGGADYAANIAAIRVAAEAGPLDKLEIA